MDRVHIVLIRQNQKWNCEKKTPANCAKTWSRGKDSSLAALESITKLASSILKYQLCAHKEETIRIFLFAASESFFWNTYIRNGNKCSCKAFNRSALSSSKWRHRRAQKVSKLKILFQSLWKHDVRKLNLRIFFNDTGLEKKCFLTNFNPDKVTNLRGPQSSIFSAVDKMVSVLTLRFTKFNLTLVETLCCW